MALPTMRSLHSFVDIKFKIEMFAFNTMLIVLTASLVLVGCSAEAEDSSTLSIGKPQANRRAHAFAQNFTDIAGGGDNGAAVVGGVPAAPGAYPAYAIPDLFYAPYLCGSTLIAPDILVTAAHCAGTFAGALVYLGANDMFGRDALDVRRAIAEYPHSHYDDEYATINDIMIVKLDTKSSITPVLYNTSPLVPADNERVKVIGFGDTSYKGNVSSTLLEVEIEVVNSQSCANSYSKVINADFDADTMLCAGGIENKGSCQGDSGGPLFPANGGDLLGIVSVGVECGREDFPVIYTRISAFDDWIQGTICNVSSYPPEDCEPPPPVECDPVNDPCPFRLNFKCDADFLCAGNGPSDCFDCDSLQRFGDTCENCIVHGGRYCELPDGRHTCNSPELALFYPDACRGAGGTDWTDDCDYTEPDLFNCFSGHTIVDVQGKGETRMDELQVGDRVLTGDGTYSKVYTFSHKDVLTEVSYLQILTESMDKRHPLEITGMHLLYVFDQNDSMKKLLFAREVKVGDFLVAPHTASQSRVVSIRSINRRGLYTPITTSGNIVANRVLTSCYTSLGFLDFYFSEQMLHWLSHGGLIPYRLFCAARGCQDETYDAQRGYNPWVGFWFDIQRILTSSAHSFLFKLSMVGATPLLLSLFFGNILFTDSMFRFAGSSGYYTPRRLFCALQVSLCHRHDFRDRK